MKRFIENDIFGGYLIVPKDVELVVETSEQFSHGMVVWIYYKNEKIDKASIEDKTGDPLNPLREDEMLNALCESVKCILERNGIIVCEKEKKQKTWKDEHNSMR